VAIECVFNKNKGYIHVSIEGTITTKEFEDHFQKVVCSKEYPADIKSLWDLRNTDPSIFRAEFERELIKIVRKYPQRGVTKRALVGNTDAHFGIARMYQMWSLELNRPLKVFRDFEEAESWLIRDE